jgi:hypothetical protein
MGDVLHFGDAVHLCKPPFHVCVLLVVLSEIYEVGHLVVEEKVHDGWLVPCYKLAPVFAKDFIEFANSFVHFSPHCNLMFLFNGLVHEDGSKIQSNGFEHGGPKVILIPGEVLIDHCSLFYGLSVVFGEIGLFFYEVYHDGSAFS